jgi:hypothetical protein
LETIKTDAGPRTCPEGFEFCGVYDATHTVTRGGDLYDFDVNSCIARVRELNPKEKSPLSVVCGALSRVGQKTIRRIAAPKEK